MKSRKQLKHGALVTATVEQLSARFSPKIADIKKAVDTLLDKVSRLFFAISNAVLTRERIGILGASGRSEGSLLVRSLISFVSILDRCIAFCSEPLLISFFFL